MVNLKLVYTVPVEVTAFFNRFLDERAQAYAIDTKTYYTINGLQTCNIINNIPDNILKHLHDIALRYVEKIAENFTFTDVKIDHIHLIDYYPGGYQEAHDHFNHEDYSFILYLCDTDSSTIFYNNNHTKDSFFGKKGNMIIFNSAISHSGGEVDQQKKVAVGGIKLIDKKWRDRSKT